MLGLFLGSTLASVICILLGYLIGVKKNLHFIAGFDEKKFVGDTEKLAKSVGFFLILVGILTFLLPFALKFIGGFIGLIFTFVIIIRILALIIYITRLNKK